MRRAITPFTLLSLWTLSCSVVWRASFIDSDVPLAARITASGMTPWVDLSTAYVLLLIPAVPAARAARLGSRVVCTLAVAGLVAVRCADSVYFHYSGQHLDWLLVMHAEGAALRILPGSELALTIALCAACGVVLVASYWWTSRRLTRPDGVGVAGAGRLIAAGAASSAVLLSALGALVGGDAGARRDLARAFPELTLVRLSIFGPRRVAPDPSSVELSAELRAELASLGLRYLEGAPYPLLRERAFEDPLDVPRSADPVERPNVIVLFFESFSAALTSVYEEPKFQGITPNLEAFGERACVVSGLYNAAFPTLFGIVSSLCSHLPAETVRGARLCSLPRILRASGYRSTYLHQVDDSYVDTGAVMTDLGFDEVLDRADVERLLKEDRKSWGYSDRQMFECLRRLALGERIRAPFLLVMPTLDSHAPFNHASDALHHGDGTSPLLDSIHTADHAFGTFWNAFLESPRKDDTIVVVLADHAMFPGAEYREARAPEDVALRWFDEILCMIYDPTHDLAGRRIDGLCSQLDLAPTILHLLGVDAPVAFEGRSLFDRRAEPRAILGMSLDMIGVCRVVGGELRRAQYRVLDAGRGELQLLSGEDLDHPSRADLARFYRFKRALHAADRIWPAGERSDPAQAEADPPTLSVAGFIERLRSQDPQARIDAAAALGALGPRALAAVPELARCLSSERAQVRAFAAEALGRIGPADGQPAGRLVELLGDPDKFVRREAVTAVGRLIEGPDRVGALTPLLADPERSVRTAAARALASGPGEDTPRLIELLASVDGMPRRAVLEAIDDADRRLSADGIAAIVACLTVPDFGARAIAAAILGENDPALVVRALRPSLESDDAEARVAAIYAISRLGARAAPLIGDELVRRAGDPSPEVRAAVANALTEIDPVGARSPPVYRALLDDEDRAVRQATVLAVANALALDRDELAALLPRLLEIAAERRAGEAILALRAIGNLGERAEASIPELLRLIGHAPTLDAAVATALGRIGRPTGDAIAALRRLREGESDEVRDAAAAALRELGVR